MLAENAERTSTAPISSAIARRPLPITCSSTGITSSSAGRACHAGRFPRPSPRGPRQSTPSSSRTCGPRTASLGPAISIGGAALDLRRAHCDELERSRGVGVAVALLVRLVEALGEPGPEGNRELERLADVAKVGVALLRKLSRLCERLDVRADRVEPLVRGNQAEGGEDSGCGRDEDRLHTQLVCERARMERPGAAERDRARSRADRAPARRRRRAALAPSRRRRPRRLRPDPAPRAHSKRHPRRARCRRATSRGQAAEQEIRVGHGRAALRRARSRRGRASRLRSPGRLAARRPSPAGRSSRLPLPTVCTASVGSRTGNPPTSRSCSRRGSPSVMAQTSVDVPPMSNVSAFGKPASEAIRADTRRRPPRGRRAERRLRAARLPRAWQALRRSALRAAARDLRSRRRRRGRAGIRPGPGRDMRRPPSSTTARTRGTRARPHGRRRRGRPDSGGEARMRPPARGGCP